MGVPRKALDALPVPQPPEGFCPTRELVSQAREWGLFRPQPVAENLGQ